MELLEKRFHAIIDMKNTKGFQRKFFKNSTRVRMTRFNISVTSKRRRDDRRIITPVTKNYDNHLLCWCFDLLLLLPLD